MSKEHAHGVACLEGEFVSLILYDEVYQENEPKN